jgi:membrane-bound lytic murein transglycosylase D
MNQAIRAANGSHNFWEVSQYLPRETRGYVPAFIGACYAMNYFAEHNIVPGPPETNFLQDSVIIVRQRLDLRAFAQQTGADFEELKRLNPELRLAQVPYSEKPYALRVPHETALVMQNIRTGQSTPLTPHNPTPVVVASNNEPASQVVYHTLASNERLNQVAQQYGVTAEDIIRWNNLQGYTVQAGHRLKIYAPLSCSGNSTQYAATNPNTGNGFASQQSSANHTPSQVTATPARQNTAVNTQQVTRPSPSQSANASFHAVRSGDSLWSISQAYGTTIEKLCELNSISRNSRLQLGQRLRVR